MLYPKLGSYVTQRSAELGEVPAERKVSLEKIAGYVDENVKSRREARLIFICTHNSRRSHMAQIWAQVAAEHYGVPKVETFSGGTEASAFNPLAVAAMERAGFRIGQKSPGSNPTYRVYSGDESVPMEAFSKVFSNPPNPKSDFLRIS